ncbi:MAG: hypothetical protein HKP10_04720 [Kiritimatiellales bacterium]|nr:hypothetical protein [Kiritimatiellales bacterium]
MEKREEARDGMGADLSFWSESTKKWTAEAGSFKVLVGSSSQNIRAVRAFELK